MMFLLLLLLAALAYQVLALVSLGRFFQRPLPYPSSSELPGITVFKPLKGLDPETREGEKAARLVKESLRLERLTDDLLSMVRAQSVDRAPSGPAALLREAAASLPESTVDLELDEAPESWPLDPDRIHRVLVNLLRNAVQASPADRPPVARVCQEGADLVSASTHIAPCASHRPSATRRLI